MFTLVMGYAVAHEGRLCRPDKLRGHALAWEEAGRGACRLPAKWLVSYGVIGRLTFRWAAAESGLLQRRSWTPSSRRGWMPGHRGSLGIARPGPA